MSPSIVHRKEGPSESEGQHVYTVDLPRERRSVKFSECAR